MAIHYRHNQQAAEQTLASLPGSNHITMQADMADPAALKTMAEAVIKQLGRVDILVNNAGVYDEHRLVETDYEAWQNVWQRTIETNLYGPANLTHCLVPHMVEQGGGKIINVSSRGAFRGEPTAPAYGASKAGLNAMSQSLAQALAPHNIFVYVVAPGFVETDMATDILKQPRGEAIRQQSPLNRVARPDEVARAVILLASDGTDFMTGSILDVNGASYLRS